MATLNFPDNPTTGDTYTDSNSGFSYEWNGTVWISTDPSTASNIREIDDISGDFDNSETDFTLKVSGENVEPVNAQQLIISLGGVMQNAGDDFTVSGSTITFTTAPQSGLSFFGTLLGTALSLNTIADGTVTPSSLSTTSNYLMNGLTLDQGAGIITAFGFQGGSVTADLDSTFAANVSIAGSLTVQGTQTIINVDELNVQDKTIGIGSTNAPSSTSQDGAGAIIYGQTHIDILYDREKASLGISTAVTVTGFVTATRAQVGTGVTINNTGIDIGIGGIGIVTTGTVVAASATVGSGVTINNTGIDIGIGGIGIVTTGTVVAASATVGSGVTINNTGIDLGIGGVGVITASRISGAGLTIADGRALVGIDTSEPLFYTGRVQVQGTNSSTSAITVKSNQNDSGGPAVVLGKSRATSAGGVTIVQDDDELGCIYFTGADGVDCTSQAAYIRGLVDGSPGSNDMPGRIEFGTAPDGAATATERLRITSGGGFSFNNAQLVERVKITAGKLSNNTDIDLADGMVHYFSTTETTTSTPNIRIDGSNTLNNAMDTGDVISVTLITTAAAAAYSAALNIDSSSATVEWSGAAAPAAGGASGLDVYAYTIIKIGSGSYKVLGNYTNFD